MEKNYWAVNEVYCPCFRVGAAMPILFSYFIEFLSKTRRGPMIGFLASFWMVGNIITSGVAWLIIPRDNMGGPLKSIHYGSWRIFVAVCSLPALTSALFVFLMPESPKSLQKVCLSLCISLLHGGRIFRDMYQFSNDVEW